MEGSAQQVLALFRRISAIPRCSSKERALSDWLLTWAADHGLECERDEVLNVLIRVPGAGPAAGAPSVALQGHMDMVCEKIPDSGHDFERDPIEPVVDGEWLTARGTTLGADNGIAIAIALAIAADDRVSHPPLELVFTVDEETGLTGAQKLRAGWLRSRILLNLDSEDEGVFTIGCAGGLNSLISVPVTRVLPEAALSYVRLAVAGLQGGHSGVDIHLGRANANVLAARLAADLRTSAAAAPAGAEGGSAHNAIPRDASFVVGLPPSAVNSARDRIGEWQRTLAAEYASTDPDLSVVMEEIDAPKRVPDRESGGRVLDAILALPHGVIRMSPSVEGLVETSTNLATVKTTDAGVEIHTSQRSSSESQLEWVAARVAAVARLAGGSVNVTSRYPAWEPRPDSELLRTAQAAYRGLYGTEPRVEVIHAGLECGVIGAKYPGMEMLSIGPTIQAPHSPDERMNLPSLDRMWDFLVQLLGDMR